MEVVRTWGVSVLNADDPTVVGLQNTAGGQLIYFSLYSENGAVARHVAAGGTAVVLEGGDVVIRSSTGTLAETGHPWRTVHAGGLWGILRVSMSRESAMATQDVYFVRT